MNVWNVMALCLRSPMIYPLKMKPEISTQLWLEDSNLFDCNGRILSNGPRKLKEVFTKFPPFRLSSQAPNNELHVLWIYLRCIYPYDKLKAHSYGAIFSGCECVLLSKLKRCTGCGFVFTITLCEQMQSIPHTWFAAIKIAIALVSCERVLRVCEYMDNCDSFVSKNENSSKIVSLLILQ